MKSGVRELEQRLREEPENLALRVALANSLHEAGRHAEAVELYRSVAVAYRERGRMQQASVVCRGILEIDPGDAATRELLATLSAPRRVSSVPASEETPLPPALPHHVADPTTNIVKKLGDLDLDPPTERVERLDPVDSDTEEEVQMALPTPPETSVSTRTPSQVAMAGAFFTPIPGDRRAAIVTKFVPRSYPAGAPLLRAGESTHPLFVVVRGEVEVRANRDGRAHVLETLREGDFVGEASLLARGAATIDAVARTAVEVLALAPRDFYALVASFPVLWSHLEEAAARRADAVASVTSS